MTHEEMTIEQRVDELTTELEKILVRVKALEMLAQQTHNIIHDIIRREISNA